MPRWKYNSSVEISFDIPAELPGEGLWQTLAGVDPTEAVGPASFTYPRVQALTLLAPGLCGLLSVFSILGLFGWIAYKHFSGSSSGRAASNFFFRNPLGLALLSLFITDLFGGISWTVMIEWSMKRKMYQGMACSFSGIAEQIGSIGAAIWNLLLSVLTFSVLVLGLRLDSKIVWSSIAFGWTSIFVFVIAGPIDFAYDGYPIERFYGPSNKWCWMGGGTDTTKSFILLTEVVCVAAAVISLVLYLIIYLRLSGRLNIVNGKISLNWIGGRSSQNTEPKLSSKGEGSNTVARGGKTVGGVSHVESMGKQVVNICKKLLLYPIIYIIIITPIAAARLFFFTHAYNTGEYLPWGVNMMAASMEALSGFCNTILFIITRHSLVLRPDSPVSGVHITTTRIIVEDYSSGGDQSNNFNLRSMGGSNKKTSREDSKGSDEDLTADFEAANARSALSYSVDNPSKTSLPQSTGGAISEIELSGLPEAHAQREAGSGY